MGWPPVNRSMGNTERSGWRSCPLAGGVPMPAKWQLAEPAFAPRKTRILEFVKSVNEVYRAKNRPLYSETISGLCAVVRETATTQKTNLCNPSEKLRGAPIENLPVVWNIRASGNGEWPLAGDSYSQRHKSTFSWMRSRLWPLSRACRKLRLFRSIAIMNRKAPLPSLRSQKPTWNKASELASKWELKQLARRLEELGPTNI